MLGHHIQQDDDDDDDDDGGDDDDLVLLRPCNIQDKKQTHNSKAEIPLCYVFVCVYVSVFFFLSWKQMAWFFIL